VEARSPPGTPRRGPPWPWNAPCLGPVAQFLGVETEKGCGLAKVEGTHEWPPSRAQGAHGEALPKGVGRGISQWERSHAGQVAESEWIIIASTSEPEPAGEVTGAKMPKREPASKTPTVRPKQMANPSASLSGFAQVRLTRREAIPEPPCMTTTGPPIGV